MTISGGGANPPQRRKEIPQGGHRFTLNTQQHRLVDLAEQSLPEDLRHAFRLRVGTRLQISAPKFVTDEMLDRCIDEAMQDVVS